MLGTASRATDRIGPVTGPIVGYDSLNPGGAVCGKSRICAVHESDCGGSFLVQKGLSVSETGVAIECGVQVYVTAGGAVVLTPHRAKFAGHRLVEAVQLVRPG